MIREEIENAKIRSSIRSSLMEVIKLHKEYLLNYERGLDCEQVQKILAILEEAEEEWKPRNAIKPRNKNLSTCQKIKLF